PRYGGSLSSRSQSAAGADPSASVHVDPFANDLRCHEDQQFIFVVSLGRCLEEIAQNRNVAEVRHLGLIIAMLALEYTAEHDGLPVVHQYLSDDFLGVDGGHVDATRQHGNRADGVL